MELNPADQAASLLRTSRTPLIIIPERPSSDALAGGLALLLVLEKLGKKPKIVSPEFSLPPGHGFLPKSDAVAKNITSLRDFIIKVDVSHTKLDSLSYTIDDDELHIHLTPKNGYYGSEDVKTDAGAFAFDAIVVIDAARLEDLGDLYRQNAEFFYHTPLLDIDHRGTNERYGHVNLVDVVASSVSEIIFDLIKRLGFEAIDEQVATTLLTGIISKTKVFQSRSVTPRSLAVASHLISAGARRDTIIQNLYQTKTLPILKLWGAALTNIKSSVDQKLVWSTITLTDLKRSGASADDAPGVLDELMVNTPSATAACLFVETERETVVHVSTATPTTTVNLPPEIKPRVPGYYVGRVNKGLGETEKDIIHRLQS